MKDIFIKVKDDIFLEKLFPNKDIVSIDDLMAVVQQLVCDKETLEEQLNDLKNDINDNYRPISKQEQYEG
jgi:hypothetical protein